MPLLTITPNHDHRTTTFQSSTLSTNTVHDPQASHDMRALAHDIERLVVQHPILVGLGFVVREGEDVGSNVGYFAKIDRND